MRVGQQNLPAAIYPLSMLLLASVAPARPAELDLSNGGSGSINSALFESTDTQPTGTGFIDSFVRIQNNGVEQGYNTSGRPFAFDEKEPLNFTHDVQLGQLGSGTTINGTEYYQFLLDINQPGAAKKTDLSLDALQFYTSPTGSKTTKDISGLGTLRYDLGDNWVLLNSKMNHGSGSGDLFAFIPKSDFAGSSPNDFVYMYSKFGLHASAEGGFEEWAAVVNSQQSSSQQGGTPPAGNQQGNNQPPGNNSAGNNPPPGNQQGNNQPPGNSSAGNSPPPGNQQGNNQPPGNVSSGNNQPPESEQGGNPPPESNAGGSNPPPGQTGNPGGGPGAVPEPSTYVVLGSFLALVAFLKRRKESTDSGR